MSILVRRISRTKWDSFESHSDTRKSIISLLIKIGLCKQKRFVDVSADAITNCLKTNENTLSVWKIESENDLNDAILALVTGQKQEKLSTIHYVLIDEYLLLNKGLNVVNFDGDTAVDDLVNTHKNISDLSYRKLGIVKDIILDCISNNKTSFFTKKQLQGLVRNAIETGRLKKEKLNEKLVLNEKL